MDWWNVYSKKGCLSKHELWSTFLQILSSTFLCVHVRSFVCMYICVQQVRSFPFSCSTLPLIIFLSMYISYYLSVGLSIYLSMCLSFYLSIYLSIYLFIFLSFPLIRRMFFIWLFCPNLCQLFLVTASLTISYFHFILIFYILFSSFPFYFHLFLSISFSFNRDSLLSYLYLHFLPPSSPHTNTRTHARRYKYTLNHCITLFPYLTIFLSLFLFSSFEGPMAQQDVLWRISNQCGNCR